MSRVSGEYRTAAKFWSVWKEQADLDAAVAEVIVQPLTGEQGLPQLPVERRVVTAALEDAGVVAEHPVLHRENGRGR